MVYRMPAIVSLVLTNLEALAARYALPSLLYLCEVAEDGSMLADVELDLPVGPARTVPQRMFFWSVISRERLDAYDDAAMQAIRSLQSMYGLVVRDCNYDCMVVYRNSMRSAAVVAACVARHAAHLERGGTLPVSVPGVGSVSLMGH